MPGSDTATPPDEAPPSIIDEDEHPVSKSARAMDAPDRVNVNREVMTSTLRPATSKKRWETGNDVVTLSQRHLADDAHRLSIGHGICVTAALVRQPGVTNRRGNGSREREEPGHEQSGL